MTNWGVDKLRLRRAGTCHPDQIALAGCRVNAQDRSSLGEVRMKIRCAVIGILAATALTAPAFAQNVSAFPTAPAEPKAVTVQAKGDGRADDTDALQQALDQALDATHHGLVFLPSGTYR